MMHFLWRRHVPQHRAAQRVLRFRVLYGSVLCCLVRYAMVG